jgi:hypothetical protein
MKNANGLFEVKIDGEAYEFEKWGAEESLDTLIDLSSMVGKPLGMAVAAIFGKDGLSKEIDPDLMGKVFESLLHNCTKEKTKPIIKKLCSEKVFCGGKKIIFDHHYQDRLMHCFKVVKANLEVQYGNFFEELLALTKLRGVLK